jgi:hypothetical protein
MVFNKQVAVARQHHPGTAQNFAREFKHLCYFLHCFVVSLPFFHIIHYPPESLLIHLYESMLKKRIRNDRALRAVKGVQYSLNAG